MSSYLFDWFRQVFIFSETGLHLETRSLFTDALLLQFSYDKSKKRLTIVKDQNRSQFHQFSYEHKF